MNKDTKQKVNIGVDTGKHQLDIYIRPVGIYFTVTNDEKGIKEALNQIKQYTPERIVIEATGRLEMPFIIACAKANLPFVIANPIHIKRFAGAIAHYSEVIKPDLTQLKPDTILQSMKGIGKIASASIISNLPELGYMTNKQASALVGVAPINRERGRYKGHRKIQGGRHQERTVLYMAFF